MKAESLLGNGNEAVRCSSVRNVRYTHAALLGAVAFTYCLFARVYTHGSVPAVVIIVSV